MRLLVTGVFILILQPLPLLTYGQQISSFSTSSMFPGKTVQFTNAALIRSSAEFQFGNISLPGPFSNIRQFYLTTSTGFGSDSNSHGAGIYINRNQRGELLSETALKGAYKYSVNINNRFYLSLGTHFGFYQLSLKSSSKTKGGNDMKVNSDWSVGLNSSRWAVGLSYSNITRPKLTLINEQLIYEPTIGVFGDLLLYKNQKWSSYFTVQTLYNRDLSEFVTSFRQLIYGKYEFGLNAGNRSVSLYLGVNELKIRFARLGLYVGYQRQFSSGFTTTFTPLQVHLNLSDFRKLKKS